MKDKLKKRLLLTSGFTQAGVYARRQFCGYLEVYRPPEPLWNPRLREAATTFHAMAGDSKARKFIKVPEGLSAYYGYDTNCEMWKRSNFLTLCACGQSFGNFKEKSIGQTISRQA